MRGPIVGDEVAVEVDIVLVDPPLVREAIRVDRVNQYDRQSGRQLAMNPRAGEPDNAARATGSLHTVGAGTDHQNALGIRRLDPRHAGMKRLARGPAGRAEAVRHANFMIAARAEKLRARFGVAGGEVGCRGHVASFLEKASVRKGAVATVRMPRRSRGPPPFLPA